jgi:hypothetical protein
MDTAHKTLPKRAPEPIVPVQPVPPKLPKPAAVKPELNRQERLISTAYLAMFAIILAFLAVSGLVVWLGS